MLEKGSKVIQVEEVSGGSFPTTFCLLCILDCVDTMLYIINAK
jgi:hypothetical protein